MSCPTNVVRALRARGAIVLLLFLMSLLQTLPASGQEAVRVDGRVLNSEGASLAGATVRIVGSGVDAITRGDGSFSLPRVLPGTHTLLIERLGYAQETQSISVHGEPEAITVVMNPSALEIGGLLVTGTLSEREAMEALRPTSVLRGQELQQRLQGTVAATVASEPGMAAATMGPGIAQPVIRGMSGDRVLMLEDGARVADVSNTHADHPTALDPTSARRIEVVRGPANLLYGSNALGGVVNVIRDEVPSSVPYHTGGSATGQAASVNAGYGVSGSTLVGVTENVPLRLEGTGRASKDLRTPVGDLVNTDAETWSASVGTGWVDEWGFVSGAVRTYRHDYGVPGGFAGGHTVGVRTEMERTSSKLRAQFNEPFGPFSSLQVDGLFSDYSHTEIETAGIVGTIFERTLGSGDVIARHEGWGPFSAGAIGGRMSWEDLGYRGQLSTPDSRRYTAAGFVFEEIDLKPVRLEAGLRYDWVQVDPGQEDPAAPIGHVRSRTFHAGSGSIGLLYDFAGGFTVGTSVAQAFRAPDVGELYSEGPHLATYSYEVGNPDLETEVGRGVDAFVRYGSDVIRAEVTGFYNDIDGYIYAENTGRISRVQLPIYQHQGNDALFTGFEGSLRWQFADGFELDGTGSYVRSTLTDTDQPLPLTPPLHGRVGLAYDRTTWFVHGETELAAEQTRVGEFEDATPGYTVYHLAGGVRLTLGGRLNVLTLSLENLTDEEYRNHLSRVKEIMPEAGRGLRLTYRVVF
ncbi:MAG: TonB-dependent receptor [Longimicrobiales bacterium]